MLIQEEIVFHEPELLLLLNLHLILFFSAVVPCLRGTQGAASTQSQAGESQAKLCFMTFAIIFDINIY